MSDKAYSKMLSLQFTLDDANEALYSFHNSHPCTRMTTCLAKWSTIVQSAMAYWVTLRRAVVASFRLHHGPCTEQDDTPPPSPPPLDYMLLPPFFTLLARLVRVQHPTAFRTIAEQQLHMPSISSSESSPAGATRWGVPTPGREVDHRRL